MAPPVAAIGDTIIITRVGGIVRNRYPGDGIRIEVVVNVQSVHIVAAHNVAHHLADVVTALLQGRIQQRQPVVLERPLRVPHHHVVTGIGVSHLGLGAIGINPRVQLHTATVALLHHPLQRVPVGIGTAALLARQIVAPRLQRTLVQRVALRPHLEDDGITAILLQLVQLVRQRTLHHLCSNSLKLSVDTLNPRTTELTFLLRLQSYGNGQQHQD